MARIGQKDAGRVDPEVLRWVGSYFTPLLLGLKELTEAYEAHKGTHPLPFHLPPEARWEVVRDAPEEEFIPRLRQGLLALAERNENLERYLVIGALDEIARGFPRWSWDEEVRAALAHLVRAVDRKEVEPPRSPLPSPVTRLVARLLSPKPGGWILDEKAEGGEVLVEIHRQFVEGCECEPPNLWAKEESSVAAFYTWTRIAPLGLPIRVGSHFVPRRAFDGVFSRGEGKEWFGVRGALDHIHEDGRAVVLLEEEDAGGASPYSSRWALVTRGRIRGAIRLDPGLFGTGGVVLFLEGRPSPVRGVVMADASRMEGSLEEVVERVLEEVRAQAPHGPHARLVPYGEMAKRGFSVNPAHYLEEEGCPKV